MSKQILIIGASRGIGLGLTKEFASRGWHVVASERSPSDGLRDAARDHDNAVEIVTVDVTKPDTYQGLSSKFGEGTLDAIIVNAGITGASHQSAEQATDDEIAHVMQTNAYGPVRVGKALLPLLKDGGTLAFMSSLMGSIADSSGAYEFYRVSKVGLNMLARRRSGRSKSSRSIPAGCRPTWAGPTPASRSTKAAPGLPMWSRRPVAVATAS